MTIFISIFKNDTNNGKLFLILDFSDGSSSMTDMTWALVRLHFFFKLLFTITTFTIMSNKFQEHCLTHWHTALPVRRGEMIQLIRPGNQSAFAFMTRINSTTPKLSITSCSTPDFSPYVAAVIILIFHITVLFVIKYS